MIPVLLQNDVSTIAAGAGRAADRDQTAAVAAAATAAANRLRVNTRAKRPPVLMSPALLTVTS